MTHTLHVARIDPKRVTSDGESSDTEESGSENDLVVAYVSSDDSSESESNDERLWTIY